MKKVIFLAVFLLFSVAIVSAEYQTPSDKSVEYGGDFEIEIDNTELDQETGSISLEGCESSFTTTDSGLPSGGVSTVSYPLTREINVPKSLQCSVGENDLDVLHIDGDGSQDKIGEFSVYVRPRGETDPGMDYHRGRFLYTAYNMDGNIMRDFVITNDFLSEVPTPDNNKVFLEEIDSISGNEYASWDPKVGGVLDPQSQDTGLESIVSGEITDDKEYTASGQSSDGDCHDDPCDIGTTSWKDDVSLHNSYGKFVRNGDTSTPVTVGNNFRPEGEIIFAEYPEFYDSDGQQIGDQSSTDFFICRDGATMNNGFNDMVPRVVDAAEGDSAQDLKQCNQATGDWEDIDECEDGLDNDGDGYLDHPSVDLATGVDSDNSCSSKDTSESAPVPSDCGEVYQNNQDEIVYRFSGTGSDQCNQEETLSSFLNDISPHTIDTFYCNLSSGTVVAEDFDNQDGDLGRANQFCGSKDLHSGQNIDTEEVKAVEFKPRAEYFSAKFEEVSGSEDGLSVNEVTPTGWKGQFFLGPNGWRTGMQTLHQAEEFYSGDEDPHEASTWASKGMKNLQDYGGGPQAQEGYKDAWESANAGTISTGDTPVASELFPGGFHGKCTGENTWDKGDQWSCIGDGMVLEFFEVNPYAYDEDDEDYEQKNYTALRLTESEANKWEAFTGRKPTAAATDGYRNLEIKARCWHGNPNQRPSNSENILVMSKEVTGGDTVLVGQLPIRDELFGNEVTGDHRTYSCNYGFQQEFTTLSAFPNGLDDRYRSGQIVGMLPFYLVQGSNENGIVRSTTTSVPVPDNFDWDEANASTNKPDYNDFFVHFPTGEGAGTSGTDSGDARNPLNVCRTINNLCN